MERWKERQTDKRGDSYIPQKLCWGECDTQKHCNKFCKYYILRAITLLEVSLQLRSR